MKLPANLENEKESFIKLNCLSFLKIKHYIGQKYGVTRAYGVTSNQTMSCDSKTHIPKLELRYVVHVLLIFIC